MPITCVLVPLQVCAYVVMASLLCLVTFGYHSGLKFMFFIFSLIVVELLADFNLGLFVAEGDCIDRGASGYCEPK